MRKARTPALLLSLLAAMTTGQLAAQDLTHVVLVVGLGGSADFRESFHAEASQIYTALTEQLGVPAEDVVYLGEDLAVAPDMISAESTRANILRVLGEISQRAGPRDKVAVILIGHGTEGRNGAQFNLPGPDLSPTDFELAMVAFPTQTLALVHTGSASGGFVQPLAGPNRIVIAATRSARETNATEFGQFFAEAMAGSGSDLDHDNRISLLEAFTYAKQEVARHYEEENEMLSEHAVLDDNGDGEGSLDANLEGPDGILAASFTFGRGLRVEGAPIDDPVLAGLLAERDGIERRIEELRVVRSALPEDEYLDRLEPLLIELALKNREIEAAGGASR
ncbi:MAG: hypothetical protein OEO79_09545 [Gemmatimonadota bacterium]|nr:hypothetical protein [Gemmatimonadota bacterium]MDH3423053.1 hypothetical protein [Gemmatimonadota bacterium]